MYLIKYQYSNKKINILLFINLFLKVDMFIHDLFETLAQIFSYNL